MPALHLTPTALLDRGLEAVDTLTGTAADGLDVEFHNSGHEVLHIENESGGPVEAVALGKDPADNITITIPDGKVGRFPLLTPSRYNYGGKARITIDDDTDVTFTLLSLRRAR